MALRRPRPIAQAEPSLVAPGIRVREWPWLAAVGGLLLSITLLPVLVAVRQTSDQALPLIGREDGWALFQVIT